MDSLPSTANVLQFKKTLATRLQECSDILQATDQAVPASRVKAEWSYFIELQIEPAGWQAFWRIPRVICESFNLAFPTVVFGIVECVVFNELRAHFVVTGVHDADIHLPERHEVALVDLFAVREQENSALNIEVTANCVDMLRYFYTHIWRPWDIDTDDDQDWAAGHLEKRIRFHQDLILKRISRRLTVYIKTLLCEASDAQQRREYLETDLSDDEDFNETQHKTEITDLMRLHLRLINIRSELDILENPDMRDIYEDVQNRTSSSVDDNEPHAFIVSTIGTIADQQEMLCWCSRRMEKADTVRTQMQPSLQQCLNACLLNVDIYLPSGEHAFRFSEPLSGKLSIIGRHNSSARDNSILCGVEDTSCLLTINGNAHIEGITFDCRRVQTGILLRGNGRLFMRNCTFIVNGKTNTKCAISVTGDGVVNLVNCSIRNFAVGIHVNTIHGDPVLLELDSTCIRECNNAIECSSSQHCNIKMQDTEIGMNRQYGIAITRTKPVSTAEQKEILSAIDTNILTQITGACDFNDNALGNIVLYNFDAKHIFDVDNDHVDIDSNMFAIPNDRKKIASEKSPESDGILVSDSESESVIFVEE